jgi:hypothetical protein
MNERPQYTSAKVPDGGNPRIRFREGPGGVTGLGYSTATFRSITLRISPDRFGVRMLEVRI